LFSRESRTSGSGRCTYDLSPRPRAFPT
jgi:hypothetical protein